MTWKNAKSVLRALPEKLLVGFLVVSLAFYVPLPARAVESAAADAGVVRVAVDNGVSQTADGAAPWAADDIAPYVEEGTVSWTENGVEVEYNAEADFVPDQILVTYADADAASSTIGVSANDSNAAAETIEEGLADQGLTVAEELAAADGFDNTMAVVQIEGGVSVREALQAAASVEGIVRVQPNYCYQLLDATGEEEWLSQPIVAQEEMEQAAHARADGDDAGAATKDEATSSNTAESATADSNDAEFAVASSNIAESIAANDDKAINETQNSPAQGVTANPLAPERDIWYLDAISAPAAWEKSKAQGKVAVAVLDTGCVLEHEDLGDNIRYDLAADFGGLAAEKRELTGDVLSNCHGTHVCGLVGANASNDIGIQGVSYNADVIPICVFDSRNGKAYSSSLIAAYRYLDQLVEDGTLDNLRVINLSLGAYSIAFMDGGLSEAIDEMRYRHNVLTVAAAGNEGITTNVYPGDYENCLCVMATTRGNSYTDFSDYNMDKDIGAPGESIVSTVASYYKGNGVIGWYKRYSGTSMASPIVAGGVALLYAADSSLTPALATAAVQETATEVTDNVHEECGSAGALDLDAALDYVLNFDYSSLQSIEDAQVLFEEPQVDFEHRYMTPQVTVVLDGKTLKEGFDYWPEYVDNFDAGTAKAIVHGTGKYCGQAMGTFEIVPAALVGARLEYSKAVYDGKAKSPWVDAWSWYFYVANEETESNDDVEITYQSGRKDVGDYWVKIVGRGDVRGTLTRHFSIVPKSTSISSKSALKGGFKVKWAKRTAQVTGYQVRYSTSSSFGSYKTKTITSNKTVSKKVTGLKKGKKYYVKVRTYKTVAGKKYYSDWSKAKTVTTKK